MAKDKNKYLSKQVQKSAEASEEKTVKMIFSEQKFFNNLNEPLFLKGKVYELQGFSWIERWQKRGGKILPSNTDLPHAEQVAPSTAKTASLQVLIKKHAPAAIRDDKKVKTEETVLNEEQDSATPTE